MILDSEIYSAIHCVQKIILSFLERYSFAKYGFPIISKRRVSVFL